MSAAAEPCDPVEFIRLRRGLERERAARQRMETVYEQGLRDLYLREAELRLVQDIATAANLSRSAPDVLQYALKRICDYTAWPIAHGLFAEKRNGAVRLKSTAWHLQNPERVESFRAMTEARDLAPGEGLPGRVYQSKVATWLSDVGNADNFPRRQSARENGIRTGCAFPILVNREATAVIELYTDRAIEPDEALLTLLPQVGVHLGRAIERQRAEDRLIHDASHDSLTGLPNRAFFLDSLNEAMARGERDPQFQCAVLFIDLDRFKIVNDSLGHQAGDSLIIQVASRLSETLRREDRNVGSVPKSARGKDTLARLGGDEFTILLSGTDDSGDVVRFANRVQEVLRLPFGIDGQDIYTTASIGIASSASKYESAEAILRDADLAMYRAKALGGARWEVFDQEMHEGAMKRLALETDLRRAVQNQEFVLHYQPIVSLQSNEVVGFEALVRWRKPDGQLVFPADFIETAEETGLIVSLGRWVLREACRAAGALQQQFPREDPLTISVNVSPRQFAQLDLIAEVRSIVAESGIDPRYLRLEITESVMIVDAERAAAVLRGLKELGIHLSIDDFGAGYSSLSYLHSLPFDAVKIDRSFVAAMDKNPKSLQIVRTMMALAGNLGMDVIAEGVEIEGQVTRLQSMGCDYGQGYFFSKPVDLADAVLLLTSPGWPGFTETWRESQRRLLADFVRKVG